MEICTKRLESFIAMVCMPVQLLYIHLLSSVDSRQRYEFAGSVCTKLYGVRYN